MCLGEVAAVVELPTTGTAVVSVGGVRRTVSLLTLDGPVTAGDWVVIHSGFALSRLTADEARDALELRGPAPNPAARRVD